MSPLIRTAFLLCVVVTAPSWAGLNTDGRIVLSGHPEITYSSDNSGYCDLDLPTCSEATTELAADGLPHIIVAYAVFPDSLAQRLTGVAFGVDYSASVFLLDSGPCSDFQIDTDTWPNSGEGTALSWLSPKGGDTIPLYWFAAYTYTGVDGLFSATAHPTQSGVFADTAVPANVDAATSYGSIGFGTTTGTAPCPPPASAPGGGWGSITGP